MKQKKFFLSLSAVLLFAVVVMATPDQPNMQSAKQNLQNAKANLNRVNAIKFVDQAIDEVKKGIEVGE